MTKHVKSVEIHKKKTFIAHFFSTFTLWLFTPTHLFRGLSRNQCWTLLARNMQTRFFNPLAKEMGLVQKSFIGDAVIRKTAHLSPQVLQSEKDIRLKGGSNRFDFTSLIWQKKKKRCKFPRILNAFCYA